MKASCPCPVCGGGRWARVETFLYSRTDTQRGGRLPLATVRQRLGAAGRVLLFARPRRRPVRRLCFSPYQLLRRRVLFEVWFPTQKTITLAAACCVDCGFVAYWPRPSDDEVAAKYAFLKQHEPDVGGQSGYDCHALKSDLARAGRVYERCLPHLMPGRLRVLDYGGGNGKLMQPFLAAGHSCYLVDYSDRTLPGVVKISDDMDAFVGDETFDLIVCSHVLEHVSDVGRLVSFLRRHLAESGVLYAEVPQEIWAGLSLEADPVTHINFFTKNSLSSLLLLNGLDPVEIRQEMADYGGTPTEVIWALARPSVATAGTGAALAEAALAVNPDVDGLPTRLPADVESLLHPSRIASLRRIYQMSIAPRLARRDGGLL